VSEIITLELPEPLASSARIVAERTRRRVEEVLVEWLDQVAGGLPVEMLPDEQVFALRDQQMSTDQQNELSALLADQREQQLDARRRDRLDELLAIYRHGMVRKAQALKTAVERGLQPSFS
jgi:hypothetical protein